MSFYGSFTYLNIAGMSEASDRQVGEWNFDLGLKTNSGPVHGQT